MLETNYPSFYVDRAWSQHMGGTNYYLNLSAENVKYTVCIYESSQSISVDESAYQTGYL